MTANPYRLDESRIENPPATWWELRKFLGPGLVVSASIVGSGELIATTTLGAKAGFVTLWVILVSCLVKVAIQLEYGKLAISTGDSTLSSFNKLPGPKLGKAGWAIWTWLILMILKFLQFGGILGGVVIILGIAVPLELETVWTFTVMVAVALLVFRGYYAFIEKLSVTLIGLFSLMTIASVAFLQFTPYAFSLADIVEGLRFNLPREAVFYAVAAFGITGVGGDEIMQYNYWCLEKGYAAYTGPRTDNDAWVKRARGWIKVMYWDAIVSMVVYTVVTAAFYVLGATVLHGAGQVPTGYTMVETLSSIYTETLGPWARVVFLIGAFIVLFSTLFSSLAGWTRTFADAFGQIGIIDFRDPAQRRRAIAILAWIIPFFWALLFLYVKLPVYMVLIGGIGTALLLLLVVVGAFHYRYRRLPDVLRPGTFYDLALWLSALAILLVAIYSVAKLFLD